MKLIATRDEVIQYLKKRKQEGARIIDFGDRGKSWTSSFSDAIVDIEPDKSLKDKEIYTADFNYPLAFENIKKYDISITSHTLEDIRTPNFLLDALERLSDEGFIIVPSSCMELSYLESFHWLGCCHHRWIFIFDGDNLLIYPKLPSLNDFLGVKIFYRRVFGASPKIKVFLKIHYPLIYFANFLFKKRFRNYRETNKREELIIYWKGKINYKFINDDFAPSGQTIMEWYKNILINDKNTEMSH